MKVSVGIMFQPVVEFVLNGEFLCGDRQCTGSARVEYRSGKIVFDNQQFDTLKFTPVAEDCSFLLRSVIIGIDFHWERPEDQLFRGDLRFIVENEKITAINDISVEEYLISVISSEMSATSSLELLRAHAVISRSWLLSQIEKSRRVENYVSDIRTSDEWTKWWDREDHTNFDVCADDHCQRYQGITRASASLGEVTDAVNSTCGELLVNGTRIADARFSKCCGGYFERFENAWEPVAHPYLVDAYDGEGDYKTDLTLEKNAVEWINSSPKAFCNTEDPVILSQVLNSYDQETAHFFRWEQEYDAEVLGELIFKKIGIDFGKIIDLIPIERGSSARIVRLKIVGEKQTCVIGKELLIRKALSSSHLYSSAFTVEKTVTGFLLHGAGWGHGVGLCQIGAAVMAHKGYEYRKILAHYFPGATIEKRY